MDAIDIQEEIIMAMAKAIRSNTAMEYDGYTVKKSHNECYMLAEIAYHAMYDARVEWSNRVTAMSGADIQNVIRTMNEPQQAVLYYLVDKACEMGEGAEGGEGHDESAN